MQSKSKFVLAIIVTLAVTAIVIVALTRKDYPPFLNQFSVTAQGRVFAKPDIALIRLGMRTEARKTAIQAFSENSKKMNEIIAKIKDLAVEEKDIKTTAYRLSPEYDYPDGKQLLKGYSLTQEIHVKVRKLDSLGKVIEAATAAGANQVGDVSFAIDDPEDLKAEARAEAIAKAKEKAQKIAELSGLKIEKLLTVSESDFFLPPVPFYGLGIGGERADMAKVAPDVQAGESEITVDVTLTYEVDD